VRNLDAIDRLLAETEGKLSELNARRDELLGQLAELQREKAAMLNRAAAPPQLRLALCDQRIFARSENRPLPQSVSGPRRCLCPQSDFFPITAEVVRNHLLGMDPQDRSRRDFTMGLYPMLLDETCWFLAGGQGQATPAAESMILSRTQDISTMDGFFNPCDSTVS
jgi:hypothetical protein